MRYDYLIKLKKDEQLLERRQHVPKPHGQTKEFANSHDFPLKEIERKTEKTNNTVSGTEYVPSMPYTQYKNLKNIGDN